jgi:hypothetical protein
MYGSPFGAESTVGEKGLRAITIFANFEIENQHQQI